MKFTSDWHSSRIPSWIDSFEKASINPNSKLKYLELGSYEGRSLVWMVENMLKHPESKAFCVDIWGNQEIRRTFLQNICELPNNQLAKIEPIRERVNLVTSNLVSKREKFDIIYIDADHRSDALAYDIASAFLLCRIGGVIIIDDYLYKNENNSPITMKESVDSIIPNYGQKLKLLHSAWQQIYQKVSD